MFSNTHDTPDKRPGDRVMTVSELTRVIKQLLERSIGGVRVKGEISNFRVSSVGHAYFALKDSGALINAVIFRSALKRLAFKPRDGLQVEVRGDISVYEQRGQYQIIAESMKETGLGDLFLRFQELKERLAREGLFDPEHKKPLPFLPRRIGVVTSPTGAAIRDILNILGRRFANLEVTIYPVRVQGEGAAQEIAVAIRRFNETDLVDVVIVGRGGGSLEDLWPFNEEIVARAIYESRLPIISAVGHETDFTIADFVADLRAPTPSAAAELVITNQSELVGQIHELQTRLRRALRVQMQSLQFRYEQLARHWAFRVPLDLLRQMQQRADDLSDDLSRALRAKLDDARQRLEAASLISALGRAKDRVAHAEERRVHFDACLSAALNQKVREKNLRIGNLGGKLAALSPYGVLNRGYSIVKRRRDQRIVSKVTQIRPNETLTVQVSDGSFGAAVLDESPGQTDLFDRGFGRE
ncbi:MAG: exodeoxyribonuclease VII large subunit [bacterium]